MVICYHMYYGYFEIVRFMADKLSVKTEEIISLEKFVYSILSRVWYYVNADCFIRVCHDKFSNTTSMCMHMYKGVCLLYIL